MATSDLLAELSKETFKPDSDGERKICKCVLKLLNDCDLWNQEVRSNPTNLSPVCTLRGVGLAWLGCRLDGRGRVDLVTKPRAEESKY